MSYAYSVSAGTGHRPISSTMYTNQYKY